MSNKYLEKIAEMNNFKLSAPTTSTKRLGNGYLGRGVRTLKMGPHTTPEDLLPNPQKMNIRID